MEEITEDEFVVLNQLATVTVESNPSDSASAGLPASSQSWNLVAQDDALKRKEDVNRNKISAPAKKTKGDTATMGLPVSSEAEKNPIAGLKLLVDKTSKMHLVVQLNEAATEEQAKAIEIKNLAMRLVQKKAGNAPISTKCTYGRHHHNSWYTNVPVRLSVISQDDNDPRRVEGGAIRTCAMYICESCGYQSNKYSMFIFVSRSDFAPLSALATRDGFSVIATQLMKENPFQEFCEYATWDDYLAWKEKMENEGTGEATSAGLPACSESVLEAPMVRHTFAGRDHTIAKKDK